MRPNPFRMKPETARGKEWICYDCAMSFVCSYYYGHVATFHEWTCSVCKRKKTVTQPRNYVWYGLDYWRKRWG